MLSDAPKMKNNIIFSSSSGCQFPKKPSRVYPLQDHLMKILELVRESLMRLIKPVDSCLNRLMLSPQYIQTRLQFLVYLLHITLFPSSFPSNLKHLKKVFFFLFPLCHKNNIFQDNFQLKKMVNQASKEGEENNNNNN